MQHEPPEKKDRAWPNPPDKAAYHGVAGEIVRKIEPHTESDAVALLIQLLVAFGSLIGRHGYIVADGARHYANLFAVLIGDTSKGRKGTSWAQIIRLLKIASPTWAENCITSGLSSGEGLIWAVRDKIIGRVPVKKAGRHTGEYDEVETDPGVEDKRLLAMEGEFAQVLKVINGKSNILSVVLRQAWDNGTLRTLTKNSPAVATDAHISAIAHGTRPETCELMAATDASNGFANRFLWACVARSKCLPEGGAIHEVDFTAELQRLESAIEFAGEDREYFRDAAAKELWADVYAQLSEGKPGLLGAVTSRAEAQVTRLAMIYAMLDCSPWIKPIHLRAALALWKYCEASAEAIFGSSMNADPLASLIRWIEGRGGSATVRDVVRGPQRYRGKWDEAEGDLRELVRRGRGRWEMQRPTDQGGRPVEVFILGGDGGDGDGTHENSTNIEVVSLSPASPVGKTSGNGRIIL
jgi:hypothetical protein